MSALDDANLARWRGFVDRYAALNEEAERLLRSGDDIGRLAALNRASGLVEGWSLAVSVDRQALDERLYDETGWGS